MGTGKFSVLSTRNGKLESVRLAQISNDTLTSHCIDNQTSESKAAVRVSIQKSLMRFG